jgi:CRP/FNR family transcriptional regulator, cyclic AMP receptor protein
MHRGQVPQHVLVLRSGRVKVTAATPLGRDVVLAFRGPGELLGELSALDQEPRSASLVALEPVEALLLGHEDFRRFLAERPDAAIVLLRLLARRLRDVDAGRIRFAASSTMGRVAIRLLELCERFGREEQGAIRIALPLSQEELAGWAGASLESVTRALQRMRSLGWLETRRREIRVLDVEALRRIAG